MKWEWLKNSDGLRFILLILIMLYLIYKIHKADIDHYVEEKIDTVYNTIILDSIKHNIIIKDSIITKIKYKYETKIIKVDSMSDSASIKLFKELCTSDSLYGEDNTD